MVASALPSTQVSINTLILLAYKRAGLLPVEARLNGANMIPKLEHGRQLLDLMLDNLATKGFIARTMGTYDMPLVAGESQYTLPDTILDVRDDAMCIPSSNTDTKHTTGELVCRQVDFATWQSLTTKGSRSSRPTLYASFRSGATVVLRFWPVPSEDATVRLTTVRLLGDNADGYKTVDLHRYWFDPLVWCLAYVIAEDSSLPADKVTRLYQISEEKKKEALNYGFEHTSQQASISYENQWSR